ncbi:MAG: hypothetical protein ACOX9E_13725 [Lentisphaeria bacterium]|jgi:hypothetical protein
MPLQYKTLSEHRTYLHEIVRLKLFFLHLWLEQHPEESFSDVIRKRVDIYRKTSANPEGLNPAQLHYDEEPWLSMENAAHAIYRQCGADRNRFERNAFEVFRDSIDARCERDYADPSVLANYQCGSLRYDERVAPDGCIRFHIANAIAPRSIFDDPKYLPGCFQRLLDIVEKVYGATHIGTHSWLNANPKWLALFPQEWSDSLTELEEDVLWNYSFWGQFITRRGTFNFKFGNILRDTGRFPYLPCCARCSIKAMREKLAAAAK